MVAPNGNGIAAPPANLTTLNIWDEMEADTTRRVEMTPGMPPNPPFLLDNQIFDHEVVNHVVPLNNIEIWELANMTNTAHPFHIHDIQFYILDIDGNAPPMNQRGRKDVILVERNQTVRFITKFEDFADPIIPYMYHCHILPHEDGGMMGQFTVVDLGTSVGVESEMQVINGIFPNPFSVQTRVNFHNETSHTYKVTLTDISGKEVRKYENFSDSELVIERKELNAGTYFLNIYQNEQEGLLESYQIVVQ